MDPIIASAPNPPRTQRKIFKSSEHGFLVNVCPPGYLARYGTQPRKKTSSFIQVYLRGGK